MNPKTIDELATDLDLDVTEVTERVAYLAEFDRVARDGKIVVPNE